MTNIDSEDFMRRLVKMTNENITRLDGTTEPIKRMFEEGAIVIGVWQDASRPYGVGTLVLKGAKLLMETITSGQPVNAHISAIPCECLEQAIASKEKFGTRDYDA
jgi:hypothetical protein